MAILRKHLALSVLLITSSILGCAEKIGSPDDYVESCVTSTKTPQAPEPWPDPVSSSVNTVTAFNNAISIDDQIIVSGNIPAPDAITQAVTITEELVLFADGKVIVNVETSVPEGKRVAGAFVQITGQSNYRVIPVNSVTGEFTLTFRGPQSNGAILGIDEAWTVVKIGDVETPLKIPYEIRLYLVDLTEDDPDFTTTLSHQDDIEYWVQNLGDIVIAPKTFRSGPLQFTLVWDQANDIDLHLYEPNGNHIYYPEKFQKSLPGQGDGDMDSDDTDGFGAENIYYTSDIPYGTYTVEVNYYDSSADPAPETRYNVFIKGCGETRSITGTLTTVKQTNRVLSFNYSANCTLYPPPELDSTDFFQEAAICDLPSKEDSDADLD